MNHATPTPDQATRKHPYSEGELQVVQYINSLGIGAGSDPIGFILASHAALAEQNEMLRLALAQTRDDLRLAISEIDRELAHFPVKRG